jgi:uncharacterized membrane protein YjjB (DUF3815 family)
VATAFVATFIAALGVLLQLGSNPQIALAASVLLLVPGVQLINSGKDLLEGHMVTGLVRGLTGAFITLAIALGVGIVITLLPLTFVQDNLLPPANLLADAFWAAVAAIGFAILFNVPTRTLIGCAACGALGHASRTFLVHSGWPGLNHIVTATLIGATAVGTLGFLLARYHKLPTVIFTVSGVIPMFPGIFAYRTMLDILQITGIINIGAMGSIDLVVMGELIPNLLTTAFMLAALALGIAAPTLLFRRRRPVV